MLLVPYTKLVNIQKIMCLNSTRNLFSSNATSLYSIPCHSNMDGPKLRLKTSCHLVLKITRTEEGKKKEEKANLRCQSQKNLPGWPLSPAVTTNCKDTNIQAAHSLSDQILH